ncbi:MAG: hypothetical protein WC485_07750, partial [Opitutaceae bacterium]
MSHSLFAMLAAWALAAAVAHGQSITPPNLTAPADNTSVAPLMRAGEVTSAPGGWIMREAAATRALQLGFSPAAAALLQELLESPETPGAAKNRLLLELAGALLDQGRLADAEQALGRYQGVHPPAYHLRRGLIAAYRHQLDPARTEAAQVRVEDLPPAERGWFDFLEGMIAEGGGDLGAAQTAYGQAVNAAVSDLQRARFLLEREKAKLLFSQATDQQAAMLARNVERYQGQKVGYSFTRQYA